MVYTGCKSFIFFFQKQEFIYFMNKRYLLIGASAASIGAYIKLRQLDPGAQITIISAEKELPYNKCLLADYLAAQIGIEKLSILTRADDPTLTVILGVTVTALDPLKKEVETADGKRFFYDALFLGMGSSPFVPPLPGIESNGVFTFHTLADTNHMRAYIHQKKVQKVVIIGAGLSGLEAADALTQYNLSITLIKKIIGYFPCITPRSIKFFTQ